MITDRINPPGLQEIPGLTHVTVCTGSKLICISGQTGECRARYSSRRDGSICSAKQTRVVGVVLVIAGVLLREWVSGI